MVRKGTLSVNMDDENLNKLAAALIESVLANDISPEDALAKWPNSSSGASKLLDQAWTRLRHFADDADIHARDPDYLRAECTSLSKLVIALRFADVA